MSEEKTVSPTPQPPELDEIILPSPDIVIPEEYISFPKADTSTKLCVGAPVTTFQAISILRCIKDRDKHLNSDLIHKALYLCLWAC